MTRILVTGINESSKDTILDLVLTGSKKIFPSFEFIDMKPLIKEAVPKKKGAIKKPHCFVDFNVNDILTIKDNINQGLEKAFAKKIKNHLIVSGYLTIRTTKGYMPLFVDSVINKLKPDVIINLEIATPPSKHIDTHAENIRLARHQMTNRSIALSYAASAGCIVKTIIVQKNNIKGAIKELTKTLEFYLGL